MLVGDLVKGLPLIKLDTLQTTYLLGKLGDGQVPLLDSVFKLSMPLEFLLVLQSYPQGVIVSL